MSDLDGGKIEKNIVGSNGEVGRERSGCVQQRDALRCASKRQPVH